MVNSKFKTYNVGFDNIISRLDKDRDKSKSFEKKFSFKPINLKVFENKNNKQYSLALPKKMLPTEMKDKPLKNIKFKILGWD